MKKSPLIRLWPYLQRYWATIVFGLLCVGACSVLRAIVPHYIAQAIDLVRAGRISAAELGWFGLLVICLSAIAGCFLFLMRRAIIDVSREVEYDYRNDFFRQLERLDPAFYDGQQTGDLMSRATSDIEAMRMVAGPGILFFANSLFLVPLVVYQMFALSPVLAALALVPLLVIPFVVERTMKVLHVRSRKVQDQPAALTTVAQATLAGIRVVKAYVQEKAEIEKFRKSNEELIDVSMSLGRVQAGFFPLLRMIGGAGLVIIVLAGGRQVIHGTMQLGDLVAMTILYQMLIWPLIAFGWVISIFQRGSSAMERLNEIFDARPLVEPLESGEFPGPRATAQFLRESAEANGVGAAAGALDVPADDAEALAEAAAVAAAAAASDASTKFAQAADNGRRAMQGGVRFRALTFTYPGAQRPALSDIDLDIPAGSSLGIAGQIGSGKSTLAMLLARLYPVERGRVFIDDLDLNDWPVEDLRCQVAIAFQEPFVFSESIADNVAFGRGAATIGEAEVADAAHWAAFHEEVGALPDQFATLLGERGINLSGGQKQRLTLARAFVRDPRILIIDDALSAVDTQTESHILASLRRAARHCTTIVIAHRLSTLLWCDNIIVLDDGRIAEQGSHQDLLKRGGIYADIYARQQLEAEVEAME